MHRFFTPLLRRLYFGLTVFLTIYAAVRLVQHSEWNRERLYHDLLSGNRQSKISAAADLAELGGQEQLVRALKADSAPVRELAVGSLWELWFHAGGDRAFRMVQASQKAVEQRHYLDALNTLSELVKRYPKYAEGWNRRATLYWMLGQYDLSIGDCEEVLALNPEHFAAWQGLGMCQLQAGDVAAACRSLRVSLKIHPHDGTTREFLKRCERLLRRMPPKATFKGEMA